MHRLLVNEVAAKMRHWLNAEEKKTHTAERERERERERLTEVVRSFLQNESSRFMFLNMWERESGALST